MCVCESMSVGREEREEVEKPERVRESKRTMDKSSVTLPEIEIDNEFPIHTSH